MGRGRQIPKRTTNTQIPLVFLLERGRFASQQLQFPLPGRPPAAGLAATGPQSHGVGLGIGLGKASERPERVRRVSIRTPGWPPPTASPSVWLVATRMVYIRAVAAAFTLGWGSRFLTSQPVPFDGPPHRNRPPEVPESTLRWPNPLTQTTPIPSPTERPPPVGAAASSPGRGQACERYPPLGRPAAAAADRA